MYAEVNRILFIYKRVVLIRCVARSTIPYYSSARASSSVRTQGERRLGKKKKKKNVPEKKRKRAVKQLAE